MLRVVPHSGGASLLGLLLVAMIGCGTHGTTSSTAAVDPEPLASCQAFGDAFARCQPKLGAPPDVARERTATTRETLHTQTLAATTEAARAALDAQCATGLQQLAAACP